MLTVHTYFGRLVQQFQYKILYNSKIILNNVWNTRVKIKSLLQHTYIYVCCLEEKKHTYVLNSAKSVYLLTKRFALRRL